MVELSDLLHALASGEVADRVQAASALSDFEDEAALEALVSALHDREAVVRTEAADSLRFLGGAKAVIALIGALSDEDDDVRGYAYESLTVLADPSAVGPLLDLLEDEDAYSSTRSLVADYFGEVPEPRAVRPLIACFVEGTGDEDDDEDVLVNAAYALGRIGDRRAIEPLIAALEHEWEGVRGAAAEALGMLGDARAIEALEALIEQGEDDEDEAVLEAAETALRALTGAEAAGPDDALPGNVLGEVRKKAAARPDLEAHLKVLASRDEDAHSAAAHALYAAGADAVPFLIRGLGERSRLARRWCAAIIVALATDGLADTELLVSALVGRSDDKDEEVRRQSAVALGRIGTPDALNALVRWAASADEVTRAAALGGQSTAEVPGAHQALLQMATQAATADGRFQAVLALGMIGSTSDLPVLREAAKDSRSKWVREAAQSAIAEIEEREDGSTSEDVPTADTESARATAEPATEAASDAEHVAVEQSADELLHELIDIANEGEISAAAYLAGLTVKLASCGSEAADAIAERLRNPAGVSTEEYRWICWTVGRIDDPAAAEALLNLAFVVFPEPEMVVQCVRALIASGREDTLVLNALQRAMEQVGALMERDPRYFDFAMAFTGFMVIHVNENEWKPRMLGSALIDRYDAAMRWEKRIHVEREYGLLPDGLDPLYEVVEVAMRAFKGPYYFRPAADRVARLAERGRDARELVLTNEQIDVLAVGDIVTLILEHEHETGWHVCEVKARIVDVPSETKAGKLFPGVVETCGAWLGPYSLRPGDRVLFLGEHVHGSMESD